MAVNRPILPYLPCMPRCNKTVFLVFKGEIILNLDKINAQIAPMILTSLNYFPVYFQALDLRPGDKGCLVARSQCHLELGNADAALTDAEATLEDNKEFIQVSAPALRDDIKSSQCFLNLNL